MASLTHTAIISRKIIRYSIYAIVTIVIARYTYLIGAGIYRRLFPAPPPPPTIGFGPLPVLPFPEKPSYEDLAFLLETPEGGLPELAAQVGVYFMPKPYSSIRALDHAKQKARSLRFDPEGREVTETLYLFQHQEEPSTLMMNIVTGVFSISYDLSANPNVIEQVPPTPEVAVKEIKSYFARANLLPDDISGPATHEFIKIKEGKFVGAISLSESNLIKVSLFRKSFNDIPSLTPDPNEANIWSIISGARRGKRNQNIAAEYHYFPLDEERAETYPLKSSEEGWEDLKSGRGHIARLGQNQEGVIKIRRVYLAYYDAGVYTPFYQPVIVFEGDNNFMAFVPAIAYQYYGEE